ncbi:MAG: ECF-type sigma factor [Planctomycetota bacterium]
MSDPDREITQLLRRLRDGDRAAGEDVVNLVYSMLRARAERELQRQAPGQTLQATALVHEVWLRLQDVDSTWNDRKHFLATASRAMRNLLIDHARKKAPAICCDDPESLRLEELVAIFESDGVQIPALDEALEQLEKVDEVAARLIELRFFGGATVEEAASIVGISVRTGERRYRFGRQWLRNKLQH